MRKNKKYYLSVALVALYLLLIIFLCSCADLVVKNIHSAPLTTQTRIIKATVKNRGLKAAPASTTSVVKAAKSDGQYTQIATFPTPPLKKGEEKELNLIREPRKCVHLKVCADINDDVNESLIGEVNNCTKISIGCQ